MTEPHRRPSHWEVPSLGVVFAAILAVLTYYGGMHPIWGNRPTVRSSWHPQTR